jgi:hypothetical protein
VANEEGLGLNNVVLNIVYEKTITLTMLALKMMLAEWFMYQIRKLPA